MIGVIENSGSKGSFDSASHATIGRQALPEIAAVTGNTAQLEHPHSRFDDRGLHTSAVAAGILVSVIYEPTKAWVYLMLGLVPGLAWLPKGKFHLDAAKPTHAIACGLVVTGLNVIAGVSGPLLDVFFVRTNLSRHAIVATKAATQAFSHTVKMVFYGLPLITAVNTGLPPFWFFVVAAPLAMIGAWLGGMVLDRMSDVNFLKYTRWIVTALGAIYLIQAAVLFATG
jgi:uncharacterized membrane protein YfcA